MSGQVRRKRHSPAVYRRRRLVALVAVLVIAAGIVWVVVAQPWRGEADAAPRQGPAESSSTTLGTPGPTDTPVPTDSSSADPADPAASDATDTAAEPPPEDAAAAKPCVAADVVVEAVTDQDTYRSGQNPQLSIRLTNQGAKDCTINVGTTSQTFTISSGSDVWWRSTDCQAEPVDMVVTLAAGQSVSSAAPLTWDRTRSNVSTCDSADRPRAPGGGASYHLSVEIGGVASAVSKQILLY
ncbi:hypothetical protein [Microbacterium ulmi]|uniref:DUF4232 domain-containing protein n=1 Tax=Microbacterium ulmi TaxID=179095 RepID=A0A7Y2LZX3_9MICO|nr:hypothetical protein [Microbacterium ulmi]NII69810.1 cytoskeletal protein RodZ [Microbacterium ulmi]NNH03219.1 hypothetical protein [Microbacterium ulmi]